MSNPEFWKRKLLAFMHDPPHKPYGIARHAETIKSNLNIFGLSEEDMLNFSEKFRSDSFASSADRFIFPNPIKGNLKTDWLDEGLPYIHPFCGTKLVPHERPVTRDMAEDWMSSALSGTIQIQDPSRVNFIKVWRLWEKNLVKANRGASHYLPYLVADTRIPDHTIWQHNALTAAIASCGMNPAFLLFQIGPVQSFIAQAKTTRDLWAGSYIMSFLNAQAMHVIASEYGPDHIIFPQIKGNPIIDKLFWEVYGDDLLFTDDALKQWQKKQLLTPSLPNRFMALVSAADREIVTKIKKKISDVWQAIESSVRDFMRVRMDEQFSGWDELWDEQVSHFPRIDCMIHPFEDNTTIINEFIEQGMPPFENPESHSTIQNLKWALNCIKDEFKDPRNYQNRYDKFNNKTVMLNKDGKDFKKDDETQIVNPGFTWDLQYLKAEWKFGAIRNSRTFSQRFNFKEFACEKRKVEKDPLDGCNEVLGGEKSKEFWAAVSKNKALAKYFRGKQRYGAMSVIKRLFAHVYLKADEGYNLESDYRIKSTYEIAAGRKIDDDTELKDGDNKYYAVICLDGDNMGQWLSGKNAQPLYEQLLGGNIKEFFEINWPKENGELKRAITPSYHLAFSEALSNFSNYCVEPIITAFKGQLIYSGGDDVLAIVPASSAIDCADALQYAFRGIKPVDSSSFAYKILVNIFDYEWSEMEKKNHYDGFLKLKNPGSARPVHPLLMPGPKMTVSAGIAIGHVKSPMQDIIQAARDAEKKAKKSGKDGFCLTIKKRSGEENSFFAHWNRKSENEKWRLETKNYCQLYSLWNALNNDPSLKDSSSRLPYLYAQYISDFLRDFKGKYLEKFDEDSDAACMEFFRVILERQVGMKKNESEKRAREIFVNLNIKQTTPENFINFWMCLAFMNRMGGNE